MSWTRRLASEVVITSEGRRAIEAAGDIDRQDAGARFQLLPLLRAFACQSQFAALTRLRDLLADFGELCGTIGFGILVRVRTQPVGLVCQRLALLRDLRRLRLGRRAHGGCVGQQCIGRLTAPGNDRDDRAKQEARQKPNQDEDVDRLQPQRPQVDMHGLSARTDWRTAAATR